MTNQQTIEMTRDECSKHSVGRLRFLAAACYVCFAVFSLSSMVGCTGEKPAPPKTAGELNEEEKKQIRELNEQRAQEWGTPKRK
jgi:hypothetical protein